MPKYTVTHPETGRKITLTGTAPPSEAELDDIFAQTAGDAPTSKYKHVTGNMNPTAAESERFRRQAVADLGTAGTQARDMFNTALNPNVRIPAANSPSDFALRVLPQSVTQLPGKILQGGYEALKGQTDPFVEQAWPRTFDEEIERGKLRPNLRQQLEGNAGNTLKGLAEAMTAPTGLMGLDRAKEAWLTDPAGSALAVAPTLKAIGGGVKAIPKSKGATLEGVIDKGIDKGIRPGVEGNRTFAQSKQYHQKAQQAVKTIIDNHAQGALKLTDEFGEASPGLPKNLRQFSQAIDQSKRNIYEQYNQMAVQSGEAGAVVDLSPIPNELMQVANNRALQKAAPGVAEYARARAKAFSGEATGTDGVFSSRANTLTAEEAQQAIAMYNQSLEAFNKNPSYDTASRAYIDSLIVNHLRKGLDSSIESATGPGYQALKNEYGALKSIERDVSRRAIVDARKNPKGLLDFSDVFSGGQVVNGLIAMNPATVGTGIASKVIANIYKRFNDPNRIVSKMFTEAEKRYTPKQRREMPPAAPGQGPERADAGMAGKVNTGGITQPGPTVQGEALRGRVNTGGIVQPGPIVQGRGFAGQVNTGGIVQPGVPIQGQGFAGRVNTGGIVQPGPTVHRMGPVNTGGIVQPEPTPLSALQVNMMGLDAPARNQLSPNLLKSSKPPSGKPTTWREYLSANMADAMKSEGSHGAAVKKMAKEWNKIKPSK